MPHGTPLAQVDVDAVRARVAALPPVGQVQVSRRWPSTLLISLTERTPAAIPAGKQFDLLDDHGVIFRTVLSPPPGVIRMRPATPGPADPPRWPD